MNGDIVTRTRLRSSIGLINRLGTRPWPRLLAITLRTARRIANPCGRNTMTGTCELLHHLGFGPQRTGEGSEAGPQISAGSKQTGLRGFNGCPGCIVPQRRSPLFGHPGATIRALGRHLFDVVVRWTGVAGCMHDDRSGLRCR